MPTRLCLTPTCDQVARYRGRCAGHARTNDQTINRAGRHIYNTRRWRITRDRYLAANPMCAADGCAAIAAHVHHVVDLAAGGNPWNAENLIGMCASCHSRVTRAGQIEAADVG